MDSTAENQEALHVGDQAPSPEAEIVSLRQECADLNERLAKVQFEYDNAQKRSAKIVQDERDKARQEAVTPVIECMDDFRLALKSEGSYEQLREGIEIVIRKHQAIGGKSTTLTAEQTPAAS